jgi:hypothetical protein
VGVRRLGNLENEKEELVLAQTLEKKRKVLEYTYVRAARRSSPARDPDGHCPLDPLPSDEWCR